MALNNCRMKLSDTWSRLKGSEPIFVVSFAFLLTFITWRHWFRHSRTRTIRSLNPLVLQTLSAFVTPTSCGSISENTSLLKSTKIIKSYLIELDLSNLIDSICTGKAELRDSSDLHDLFRGRLRIYGWHFDLLVDKNWSFKISRWMIVHFAYIFPRVRLFYISRSSLTEYFEFKSPTILKEPWNTRTALMTSYPLDLDFVPFHKLEKEINKIQSSLQSGSTTILEFSCLASEVRFMSRKFILCAIPFLLRTYNDPKKAFKYGRTIVPLLTGFNTFVAIMSSESSTIKSIGNISSWHAHSLLQLEERLSNDRHLRMTCVREEGIAGWREKKFMLAWEAGLLRAGFLMRWRVVLVK